MNEVLTPFESTFYKKFQPRGSRHALASLQHQAFEQFWKSGFPKLKSEAYKYTPITRILEKHIDLTSLDSVSPARKSQDAHFFPVKGANHLVFFNGTFDRLHSVIASKEKDLKIKLINGPSYDTNPLLGNLGKLEIGQTDPFNILNLGLFRHGLYLEASEKSVNRPVFIYHIVDSRKKIVIPRIYIHADPLSRLEVYETVIADGSESVFFCQALEAEVKEGALVNYTKIQNYPANLFAVESTYGHLLRDARLFTNTYSFKGGLIRNNVGISIDGENCEGHMNGLYQLSGETHVDNNTAVDHRKPNSFSNELYKGILDEKSRAVFNGRIYVRPDAQKTNAFQSNNNILLSETAVVNTKPQLEIWADDVKCSHGCTTGQLDGEAIFYLRSRGIEKTQARALLLNAFANETLQSVNEEVVKSEIESLILNKLGHE